MSKAIDIPFVCLAVSGKCNLTCRYCTHTGDGCVPTDDQMSTSLASRLLNVINRYGIREVRLSGREPLLHSRIHSIIESALNLKFEQVRINTNGTIPIQSLLPYAGDCFVVIIKLDTLNPYIDLWLHGRPIAKTGLANIKYCIEHNLRTRINTVISSSTQRTLPSLVLSLLDFSVRHKLLQLEYYPDIHQFYDQETVRACEIQFPYPDRIVKTYSYRAEFGYGLDSAVYASGYTLSRRSAQFGGARYAGFCRECPFYQCQEGLYHIYCSQFGTFRPCKKGGPTFAPVDVHSEEALLLSLDDAVRSIKTDVHFAGGASCLSLNRSPHAGGETKEVSYGK